MPVRTTAIDGLLVVDHPEHRDDRGTFRQTYQANEIAAVLGRPPVLRQGNHSRSAENVLRGFHAEAWDKLLYVVRGTALCVVADVRPESPTFARAESFLLGDAPGRFSRLFVSEGLANAFYCLTEVDYINDVSLEFDPAQRGGVRFDDPDLAVAWPTRTPVLSAVDRGLPFLRDLHPAHPRFAG